MTKIFIYIPDNLNFKKCGYLEGFVKQHNGTKCYYITKATYSKDCTVHTIGICSADIPTNKTNHDWIHININNLDVRLFNGDDLNEIICIYYDYERFKRGNSFTMNEISSNEHFITLCDTVNEYRTCKHSDRIIRSMNSFLKLILAVLFIWERLHIILKFSAVYIYMHNNILNIKHFIKCYLNPKRPHFHSSSLGVSRLLDLILGFIVIYFYRNNEDYILRSIKHSTEFIINALKDVLHTLMGSPAGLKLNFALNRTLGIFFFYHISLWGAFVNAISNCLSWVSYLIIFSYPFGFSFQLAVLTDVINFLTFHVYCIYVYAARLYGVQLYGLISLWRLFIGRKYNPLRDRVDSFEYSHNQLFIGTLAFTVLLFLMPTTFLYYAVLTMFRVLLIVANKLLTRLSYIFQNVPLYVIILWFLHSDAIRGTVYLQAIKNNKNSTLYLHATLKKVSLSKIIKSVRSPMLKEDSTLTFKKVLKGSFTGTLL